MSQHQAGSYTPSFWPIPRMDAIMLHINCLHTPTPKSEAISSYRTTRMQLQQRRIYLLSQPSNFSAQGMTKRGLEARTRQLETLTLWLQTLSSLKSCLYCKNMLHKLAKLQKSTYPICCLFICWLLLLYERTTNNISNDGQ